MGPKPQLTVKVEHPPQKTYILDLLAEGAPADCSALSQEEFNASMEELGFYDPTLYYALTSEVPKGWHACLSQNIAYPPIWEK